MEINICPVVMASNSLTRLHTYRYQDKNAKSRIILNVERKDPMKQTPPMYRTIHVQPITCKLSHNESYSLLIK